MVHVNLIINLSNCHVRPHSDTISGKTSTSERPECAPLLAKIRNGETLVVKLDRRG